MARTSLELNIEHGPNVEAARALQTRLDSSDLHLVKKVMELNSHAMEGEDVLDGDDVENRDPAIVAMDVASQIVRSLSLNL